MNQFIYLELETKIFTYLCISLYRLLLEDSSFLNDFYMIFK